mmetsp:Transcript_3946/g.6177  ORF Transcript_3946/g.6177 Transcript_3946/m.6177 type:complete len:268 (+) Transcript_3946:59-862(+)
MEFTGLQDYTIGLIGCGKIGNAVARGYAGADPSDRPRKIIISPRNAARAKALKEDYSDVVEVAESNQDVVERADVIFVGLVPEVAREVLPQMPFTERHLLVSMMAAVNYEEFTALCKRENGENCVKIVPLPSAARRSGPILFYPPHPLLEKIVGAVGTPVPCTQEAAMKPLISVAGHISPFYELMRVTQKWIEDKGLPAHTARLYVSSFYSSLAIAAFTSPDDFGDMVEEAATPGGLNEQSTQFLRGTPHFQLHEESLQTVLDRLNK